MVQRGLPPGQVVGDCDLVVAAALDDEERGLPSVAAAAAGS
ncbi:MAG: hypothetical protein ACLQDY_21690 [Streptosporangiaceae bacterium]